MEWNESEIGLLEASKGARVKVPMPHLPSAMVKVYHSILFEDVIEPAFLTKLLEKHWVSESQWGSLYTHNASNE